MKTKKPTAREKVEVYERLLHDIHYHRTVTMNTALVQNLLVKIGVWSDGHTLRFVSEKQREQYITEAFLTLKNR